MNRRARLEYLSAQRGHWDWETIEEDRVTLRTRDIVTLERAGSVTTIEFSQSHASFFYNGGIQVTTSAR